MADSIHWTGDLPSGGRMKWPCTCLVCGLDYIWVVMTERCVMQNDGTFRWDGEPVDEHSGLLPSMMTDDPVKDYGYPLFWKRGREEDVDVDPPFMKPNWTKDVSCAKHFTTHEECAQAAAEAVLLHPTAIGKLRAIQFRIR